MVGAGKIHSSGKKVKLIVQNASGTQALGFIEPRSVVFGQKEQYKTHTDATKKQNKKRGEYGI